MFKKKKKQNLKAVFTTAFHQLTSSAFYAHTKLSAILSDIEYKLEGRK